MEIKIKLPAPKDKRSCHPSRSACLTLSGLAVIMGFYNENRPNIPVWMKCSHALLVSHMNVNKTLTDYKLRGAAL